MRASDAQSAETADVREVVDVYGDNEYAVVRTPDGKYEVATLTFADDPEIPDWDFEHPLTFGLDTEEQAWSWICGYDQGSQDNR